MLIESLIDAKEANKTLNLSNLYITTDCLTNFSLDSLFQHRFSSDSSDEAFDVTSLQDAFLTKCLHVVEICLNKNGLRSLPTNLISAFSNLEIIDLSDNRFEAVNLLDLSKFGRLKEMNFSNNFLKWFMPTDKNSNETIEDNLSELDSFFSTIEKLDLSNNQLSNSNCIIISQFRNLR